MKNEKQAGYFAGWFSIILNTALFVMKYWVGKDTRSIAMMADAWHTLSDSLSSVVVIAGFWLASKPPDNEHPFGHGRGESVAAIVVATLLGIIGINFFIDSINSFSKDTVTNYSNSAIIIFAISIFIKEIMAQVSFRIGRKLNSPALKADGWHHRSDAITTIIIVIGAIFGAQYFWIDGVLGLIVSLLLLYATYEIFSKSLSSILGEKPDDKLLDEISTTVLGTHPLIEDAHHFMLHNYGDQKNLAIDIRLPDNMSVKEAHDIASDVSKRLKDQLNIIATVHVEPLVE